MTARTVTPAEARALLDAARLGAMHARRCCEVLTHEALWSVRRADGTLIAQVSGASGDRARVIAEILAAAPDLAATVEHLHAQLRPWQDAAADATTLRVRAEAERDAAVKRAANAESMRDAFVACAANLATSAEAMMADDLRAMLACAEADRDAALAHAAELTRALRIADRTHDATLAERDALRATIEGRTTPPTDAEITAHEALGGWWTYLPPPGQSSCTCHACAVHQQPSGEVPNANVRALAAAGGGRWWSLDAQRRPCAWPEVTP